MQVLIRKAKVVDPQSEFHEKIVDILIEDGIIRKISSEIQENIATEIQEPDLMVSTGWVDVFADYCEPGFEHRETIVTGLNAASAGGFTDVLISPNTQPTLSSKSAIEFVLNKAKGNAVNLHPFGTVTQNIEGKNLAEMIDMMNSGAVAFSDGWKPIQQANIMLKALEYVKAFNGTLVQIPFDVSLVSDGLMNEGEMSVKLGIAGIPALAETIIIYRDIELLRYTGSKLHIAGISVAESVALIRKAKAEGLQITCSVTPYHLTMTDELLISYNSIYKVAPPLRCKNDRQALISGLIDGTIDCIATHHNPQDWDAKTKEFEYAAYGMALQENAFNIIWDHLKDKIAIDRLVECMTIIPRTIFGLERKEINIGANACLTLFSPSGNQTLKDQNVESKSRNNPFIEKRLEGKVIGIYNNGQLKLKK